MNFVLPVMQCTLPIRSRRALFFLPSLPSCFISFLFKVRLQYILRTVYAARASHGNNSLPPHSHLIIPPFLSTYFYDPIRRSSFFVHSFIHSLFFSQADATLEMEQRDFFRAGLEYVQLIQEVQERKKFEFVETLLGFMYGWLTFYHQGHEVATDFKPHMTELQTRIQKVHFQISASNNALLRINRLLLGEVVLLMSVDFVYLLLLGT